ncbi:MULTISPECIES: hypothetical protein, partial [unclassified Lysobacter]|uniref:hypothetical protein n=1 Tax=unclassified Lysobacter TaxID=2635362 RepID=UPI00307EF486
MRLIVHNERVFSVEDFLGAGECEALIELAEARGFYTTHTGGGGGGGERETKGKKKKEGVGA